MLTIWTVNIWRRLAVIDLLCNIGLYQEDTEEQNKYEWKVHCPSFGSSCRWAPSIHHATLRMNTETLRYDRDRVKVHIA